MSLKHTNLRWAAGILAVAAVAWPVSEAGAGVCGSCHFRPGRCPSLPNTEYFGYNPPVWQLWPGPLDSNTAYPSRAPMTMPPAEPAAQAIPKTLPIIGDKQPIKPAAQSTPAPAKNKSEKSNSKPVPVSTYQMLPDGDSSH
jgi:hypothetical protein